MEFEFEMMEHLLNILLK